MDDLHEAGFVTLSELDGLLSERTRQRWQSKGFLPHPVWLHADRARIGLFPTSVLLCLVSDPYHSWRAKYFVSLATEIETTSEFQAIGELIKGEVLDAASGTWTLTRILESLSSSALLKLRALTESLASISDALADASIQMTSIASRVVDTQPDFVLVDVQGMVRRFEAKSLGRILPGQIALIRHLQIEERSRDFLLPTLESQLQVLSEPVASPPLPSTLFLSPAEDPRPRPSTLFRYPIEHASPVPTYEQLDAMLAGKQLALEDVIYRGSHG